jgi:hypothetical protein
VHAANALLAQAWPVLWTRSRAARRPRRLPGEWSAAPSPWRPLRRPRADTAGLTIVCASAIRSIPRPRLRPCSPKADGHRGDVHAGAAHGERSPACLAPRSGGGARRLDGAHHLDVTFGRRRECQPDNRQRLFASSRVIRRSSAFRAKSQYNLVSFSKPLASKRPFANSMMDKRISRFGFGARMRSSHRIEPVISCASARRCDGGHTLIRRLPKAAARANPRPFFMCPS